MQYPDRGARDFAPDNTGRKMTTLLTTHQVQALLQVDRTTIYRMVDKGRLPAIRVGKQWRFEQSEIEAWLREQTVAPARVRTAADTARAAPLAVDAATRAAPGRSGADRAPDAEARRNLDQMLPPACAQLLQDAFAEILGLMAITVDMDGRPITRLSNPSSLFTAMNRGPAVAVYRATTWQHLAADPHIEPRFLPGASGLLWARGLIRAGSALKGMLVVGGIAPDDWQLAEAGEAAVAESAELNREEVVALAKDATRLSPQDRQRALKSVQRLADVFSHIAVDRQRLCGRLEAIASLTSLEP